MSVFRQAPPGLAPLPALAAWLLQRAGASPLALADWTVLVPTRRAERALAQALMQRAGRPALLLPRILPLAEPDEDDLLLTAGLRLGDPLEAAEPSGEASLPPPIPLLRREALLATLIARAGLAGGWAGSWDLARSLALLLDILQRHGVAVGALTGLEPSASAAEHAQRRAEFLRILGEYWPRVLEQEGAMDPAERRQRLIRAQAAAWSQRRPKGPVAILAVAGIEPAAIEILRVVAGWPESLILLPHLQPLPPPEVWPDVPETHPLAPLKPVLTLTGLPPEAVPVLALQGLPPVSPALLARQGLLAQAFQPLEAPEPASPPPSPGPKPRERAREKERAQPMPLPLLQAPADPRLHLFVADSPESEAQAIAIWIRRTLEQAGATASLITPDRLLARRVAAHLQRWGIQAADAAGQGLESAPAGLLLRLLAQTALQPGDPLNWLSLLKHPLVQTGRRRPPWLRDLRRIEIRWRQKFPIEPILEALGEALEEPPAAPDLLERWSWVLEQTAPLRQALAAPEVALQAVVPLLAEAADRLTQMDPRAAARDDVQALTQILERLPPAVADLAPVPSAQLPALLAQILASVRLRPGPKDHPRVFLRGLGEARGLGHDVVILGGLNEGVWPSEPPPDPWLTPGLRQRLGLPGAEAVIGLGAADFVQALAAGSVLLTRAGRVGGVRSVPCRWLLRLAAAAPEGLLPEPPDLRPMLQALDRPKPAAVPGPPAFVLPPGRRPRKAGVTAIGDWLADPYAFAARQVLRLKPLPPLGRDLTRLERGGVIHAALEALQRRWMEEGLPAPEAAAGWIAAAGQAGFGRALTRPQARMLWWPVWERLARWLMRWQRLREADGVALMSIEEPLMLVMPDPAGPGRFTLTARVDRIDRLGDGGLEVLDVKTGAPPTDADMISGRQPQLPLEALILARAGMPERGIAPAPVQGIMVLHLTGRRFAGEAQETGAEKVAAAVAAAEAGLTRLLACYARPEMRWEARPDPATPVGYALEPYAYLERVAEWLGEE